MDEHMASILSGLEDSRLASFDQSISMADTGCRRMLHDQFAEVEFPAVEHGVIMHLPGQFQLAPRTCGDRKSAMKVYMREYRRRQKYALNSLPGLEKEHILEQQRSRVRDRVRRHRQRKKLRSEGLAEDEVDRRVRQITSESCHRRVKPLKNPPAMMPTSMNCQPHCIEDMIVNYISNTPSHDPMTFMNLPQQLPIHANNLEYGLALSTATPLAKVGLSPTPGLASGDHLDPQSWDSSQVCIFLNNLQLGSLRSSFEEFNIDGRTLLALTPETVNELCCVPNEIRPALLSAIDSLKQVSCG